MGSAGKQSEFTINADTKQLCFVSVKLVGSRTATACVYESKSRRKADNLTLTQALKGVVTKANPTLVVRRFIVCCT